MASTNSFLNSGVYTDPGISLDLFWQVPGNAPRVEVIIGRLALCASSAVTHNVSLYVQGYAKIAEEFIAFPNTSFLTVPW